MHCLRKCVQGLREMCTACACMQGLRGMCTACLYACRVCLRCALSAHMHAGSAWDAHCLRICVPGLREV